MILLKSTNEKRGIYICYAHLCSPIRLYNPTHLCSPTHLHAPTDLHTPHPPLFSHPPPYSRPPICSHPPLFSHVSLCEWAVLPRLLQSYNSQCVESRTLSPRRYRDFLREVFLPVHRCISSGTLYISCCRRCNESDPQTS